MRRSWGTPVASRIRSGRGSRGVQRGWQFRSTVGWVGSDQIRSMWFAIGSLTEPRAWRHPRYTVDTPADLAFARAVAARLPGRRPPARLATLESIVAGGTGLAELNATVSQRSHHEAELNRPRKSEES